MTKLLFWLFFMWALIHPRRREVIYEDWLRDYLRKLSNPPWAYTIGEGKDDDRNKK